MWLPLLLTVFLSISVTSENQDTYDYSFSIDSNSLDGLRRPDGHDNEDIVCEEGKEVHIDGVWFGYQNYQKIPQCHQDKSSQDCLFNLTSSPLDCHQSTCKFPELSHLPSKDDIPSKCRSGLRYWHVCFTCLHTEPSLSDDHSQYEDYYYYDYDYEASQTTYRFDVGGNEDLTCENDQHHLEVESVKYGFDKEVIKQHMFEDGDSDCVFDFTNEFVQKLCSRTECKSPILKDLGKYNVGKNCKEKALLGMWEIIYTCMENQDIQDAHLQNNIEIEEKMDSEATENKDMNLVEDESKDKLNTAKIDTEEKVNSVEKENTEKPNLKEIRIESTETQRKYHLDQKQDVNEDKLEPIEENNYGMEDPKDIKSEEKFYHLKDKNKMDNYEKLDQGVKNQNQKKLAPKELESKKNMDFEDLENKDIKESLEISSKDKVDQKDAKSDNKDEPLNVSIKNKLDQIVVKRVDNQEPIKDESESKMESKKIELDQEKIEYEDRPVFEEIVSGNKWKPAKDELTDKLKPKEIVNKEGVDKIKVETKNKINSVQFEDKIESEEVKSEPKLSLILVENKDQLPSKKAKNRDKLDQEDIKNENKYNSLPVVPKHVVEVKQNLFPVIPTIETVLSTEINDKLGPTSIKPVTVPTKAATQDVIINGPITKETPLINDKILSNNDNLDNITLSEEMSEDVTETSSSNTEITKSKSTTKRAAKPTVPSKIKMFDKSIENSNYDGKRNHDKDKDDIENTKENGFLSWFSFSKKSNDEPDKPREGLESKQDRSEDIGNEKNTPVLVTKSQLDTTEIPIINHSEINDNLRHQTKIENLTGTTKIYQEVHSTKTVITVNPTEPSNIQVTKKSSVKDEVEYKNSFKSAFEPTEATKVKTYNSISEKDVIILKSGDNLDKDVENTWVNDNKQQNYKQNSSQFIEPTNQEVPLQPRFIQQEHKQIDPNPIIHPTSKVPIQQKNNNQEHKQIDPNPIIHPTSKVPIQQKNNNQENKQKDPKSIVDPTSMVPIQQKDNKETHKIINIKPVSNTTQNPKEIYSQIIPQEPIVDKQTYLQEEPKSYGNMSQIVPLVASDIQQDDLQNRINKVQIDQKDDDKSQMPIPEIKTIKNNIHRSKNNLKHEVLGHKENADDNQIKLKTPLISLDDQSPTKIIVLSDGKIQMSNNESSMQKNETKHHFQNNKKLSPAEFPNLKETLKLNKQQKISEENQRTVTARPSLAPISDINNHQDIFRTLSRNENIPQQSIFVDSDEKLHKMGPSSEYDQEENMHQEDISISIEKKILEENVNQKMSHTDLEIDIFKLLNPATNEMSVNKVINNTSNKLSQSLSHEKNNSVKNQPEKINLKLIKNYKKIDGNSQNSNLKKNNISSTEPTTNMPREYEPTDISSRGNYRLSNFQSKRVTRILPTTTPNVIKDEIPKSSTIRTTTNTGKTPLKTRTTTSNGNNIKPDSPTKKDEEHPTTIQNQMTTTPNPDIKPEDTKDFSSSNSTSNLSSDQSKSVPISSSVGDINDPKQLNENFDHINNVTKDNSLQFKGDIQLEEQEDPSVKVSWFSTSPEDFDPETETSTPEMTTGLYTGLDLIVGDLLNGDTDIPFDQKYFLTSNVKINQVEILHFVEETEREMSSDIDHLKHDLDNLFVLDDSMKDFPEIIQEVAKERVENFFISMSASLKKVKLGNILKGPKASSQTTDDSKPSQETNTASNLLNVTADISEKLSRTLKIGSEIDIDLPDIAMTVRKKSLSTNSSSRWEGKAIEVNLPDQESIAGKDSTITVSFTAYNNLGSMMALNENFSSSVLSVNVMGVEGAEESIQLTKPLQFKLSHNALTEDEQRNCVYWDFGRSSWSEEGCIPVLSTSTENSTTCECHHLTNFAILIDMHGLAVHEDHKPFLDILTNIGCLISMTGLILCILIYSTFRSAKNERSTININLCMCLLLSELIFMFGIGQTHSPALCAVISAVLHYIFLASFFWMLIAGFQIYVLLVEVFEVDGSRFVHYYLLGYIAPLIIVLFSLLFDTLINPVSVYGTDNYCWMKYGLHLGVSFLCPLSLVMTANIYFLIVAFHRFHVHSMEMIRIKSRKSSIKTYLNGLFGLLFLLGVSWAIGLFSLIYPSIVLSYIFTVLNSLQGFFIFCFNCVGNNKIRSEGSRKMREMMACIFNINLRRRLSRNSSSISDTKTTDVKEYFMPEPNQYCVNYSEGDKRQYRRLPQVARDLTYYY